jgi:hypothetical protein
MDTDPAYEDGKSRTAQTVAGHRRVASGEAG